jgi:peptidyl-Lys metalloendopeptidase
MFRSASIAVLVAAAAASVSAFAQDGLDVRLSIANPVIRGDVDVKVDVTVTNTTGHAALVLKSQLPGKLQGPLFDITREDGSRVAYVGPIVKRVAPRAGDFVLLPAGGTLSYQVELTGAYDLEANGRYAITYDSPAKTEDGIDLASAAPLYVWLVGRTLAPAAVAEALPQARGQAGTISYTGGCTSSEKSQIQSAVSAATNYANSTYSYLSTTTPSGTQRFVKWFGTYSSSHWSTAKTHFSNEKNAFGSANMSFDCSCTDSGTYAYVYPTQPYKFYLCGAFWSAPTTGTDSKGGTLIHEMSHFNVIAGTQDYVYGQTAAANLAKKSPTKALNNADNHEYFAENNPTLP